MITAQSRFAARTLAFAALATAAALLVASAPPAVGRFAAPAATALLLFLGFVLLLHRQLGDDLVGDLGFLYSGFVLAYTLIPAAAFVWADLDGGSPLAALMPDYNKLAQHLWRHTLFLGGFISAYLLGRGIWRRSIVRKPARGQDRDQRTIITVSVVLAVALAAMLLMSAPVSSYYDHHTRYDHLPWLQRKMLSVCIRLSLGMYCVLLVFLFRNFRRYRFLIPLVVVSIVTFEVVYTFGARIQALIVLLQALCLYHFTVKRVSLKRVALAFALCAAIFSAIEVARPLSQESEVGAASLLEGGLKPASEFGAVFYPSFHLYEERANGSLPPREWPMLFNDAISLVTFGAFNRWNPMNWYARNYYPTVEIPPFTVGPIAESALWGGEVDLLLRAVLNGLFFAAIMGWFVKRANEWWALSIYAYCYATAILTIKYSVLLHLTLIEKNLLPTLFLVFLVRVIRWRGEVSTAKQLSSGTS